MGPLVNVTKPALGAPQSRLRLYSFPKSKGFGPKTNVAQLRCLEKEDTQLRLGAANLHHVGSPGWLILKFKVFLSLLVLVELILRRDSIL